VPELSATSKDATRVVIRGRLIKLGKLWPGFDEAINSK